MWHGQCGFPHVLSILTGRLGRSARLVSFDMRPEAVLVGDVANLPVQSVFVFVTVGALHLHRVMALLLLPLFVALVVDDFVAVLVRMELVFVLFMMLRNSIEQRTDVS